MIHCVVKDLCLRIPYHLLHAVMKQETERKHDAELDVRIEMLVNLSYQDGFARRAFAGGWG